MRNSQIQLSVKIGNCPRYILLDSGGGEKLEYFAGVKIVRPEPKAWWKKLLSEQEWRQADAFFEQKDGIWRMRKKIPSCWNCAFDDLKFELRLNNNSKHLGLFPEQEPHWTFIKGQNGWNKTLLNLFGYTGAASLYALKARFSVVHVDASSPSLSWAKKNLELSRMIKSPIRWILDDAVKFVNREIRRGKRYDAIILDPPAFGRGPKGELWKLENSLPELLSLCAKLLSENPLFILLTIYNIEASALMPANLFRDIFGNKVTIEFGELALSEKISNRMLPMSLWNLCKF